MRLASTVRSESVPDVARAIPASRVRSWLKIPLKLESLTILAEMKGAVLNWWEGQVSLSTAQEKRKRPGLSKS
jgi:hypothetical protein